MSNFRLFDLLTRHKEKFNKQDALGAKVDGKWITYSTDDFINYANNISYGLLSLGVQKGDKIALIANNRPEWNFADMGIMQTGAINVPIYPTISDNDLEFIFNDAEIKFVFVSSAELFEKVRKVSEKLGGVKAIFTFDKVKNANHYLELVEKGKAEKSNLEKTLEEVKASIDAKELATMLYTSGTTGNPKGVMLSHNNLSSNFIAVRNLPPVQSHHKALSFLPLNHVFERMLTYLYMYLGVTIYYAESIETIGDNLKEVKPDAFSAVPRLLEKVYDKIVAKGAEAGGIKTKLFFWALNLGLDYDLKGKGFFYHLQLKLANKIIFSKWREALGGNVRVIVSGGAALNPRLAKVFTAAGVNVLEGYGLTETSPVIAVNNLEDGGRKFGTVGLVIEGVTVKIAEDGEILCKGPNVMMGYYKRPDLTAEVIDEEGWFHTGDIGIFEEGKYLKITDRKKEIFKTSGGKYIAPQMIENRLKESPFIEQVMVVGDGKKYASALIVPTFLAFNDWASKNGTSFKSNEEMIKNEQVIAEIQKHVDLINKDLAQFETIKKFRLLPKEWTIDSGQLTPKMSLKRKIIHAANLDLIESMYND
jgi:long-chain acyl-CoA synthetase